MISADVLVVGSGPVGLWVAFELRRAGVDVLVVDSISARDSRNKASKALVTSASTLEIFHLRNVVDQFLNQGIVQSATHFAGLDTLLKLNENVLGTKYSHGLIIPQSRIENILLDLCETAGVRFEWGLEFCGIEQTPDEVVATADRKAVVTDDQSSTVRIRASWLVGCDGTHSKVRQASGIAFEGTPSLFTGMLADVRITQPVPLGYKMSASHSGGAMVVPLGDGIHHRVIGILKGSREKPPSEPLSMNEILECLRDTFGSDIGAHSPIWLSRFGSACRTAQSFRDRRVFLAGDAAHQLFPAGGQGLNIGFQDATNLAWKLSWALKGDLKSLASYERVLTSYSDERRTVVLDTLSNIQAQALLVSADSEPVYAMRKVFAEAIRESEQLNTLWARRISGFGEPSEPFTKTGNTSSNELIGTRLSHLILKDNPEIKAQAFHQLLSAILQHRFVLILRSENESQGTPDTATKAKQALRKMVDSKWEKYTTVVECATQASHAKWVGILAVLIRPDSYIAWVGSTSQAEDELLGSLEMELKWWCGSHS
ncbi:FAD binding domain-containing protein [Talaromyces proteolyticus]|uniref:FAD binding domain-containing protein n=1 Tax=Talaromyces proteolyticus TaxID=1131652 RepID=A0AAD4KJ13_9EURO|nr:FAD binding domain-containing protein [Talaromyces proteolyticus]KAH8692794.1 FAD binding domain-containing protein [Talaromyces proteolyticus]